VKLLLIKSSAGRGEQSALQSRTDQAQAGVLAQQNEGMGRFHALTLFAWVEYGKLGRKIGGSWRYLGFCEIYSLGSTVVFTIIARSLWEGLKPRRL
jgi:hypothetical protein